MTLNTASQMMMSQRQFDVSLIPSPLQATIYNGEEKVGGVVCLKYKILAFVMSQVRTSHDMQV